MALAPAGGWAVGDDSFKDTLEHFPRMQELAKASLPYVDAIVSSPGGRRRATEFITTNYEHIPPELIAHQLYGVASCTAVGPLIAAALQNGWNARCGSGSAAPCGSCGGQPTGCFRGRQLPPATGRTGFPSADWVELDGIGHCPQLDVPLETAELITGF